MKIVNVHEAKTHLSKLLLRVSRGEEVMIARSGEPVARLTGLKKRSQKRKPGSAKGKIKLASNFDDPLPEDMLKGFER